MMEKMMVMIMMLVTIWVDNGDENDDMSDGGGLRVGDCGNKMLTMAKSMVDFLTMILRMMVMFP